jgi:hypothetical protein
VVLVLAVDNGSWLLQRHCNHCDLQIDSYIWQSFLFQHLDVVLVLAVDNGSWLLQRHCNRCDLQIDSYILHYQEIQHDLQLGLLLLAQYQYLYRFFRLSFLFRGLGVAQQVVVDSDFLHQHWRYNHF